MYLFSQQWWRYRTLVNGLTKRPLDLDALTALRAELTYRRADFPLGMLWRILRLSDKALAHTPEPPVAGVVEEIRRSTDWELSSRNRAA